MASIKDLKLYINYRKEDWTEAETELLGLLLDFSAEKILNTKYPFGYEEGTSVPRRYDRLQVRVAAELFSRIGAFGEAEHDENGIRRLWDTDDVAQGMLTEVMPSAGVI